jgi:hypothetical protein
MNTTGRRRIVRRTIVIMAGVPLLLAGIGAFRTDRQMRLSRIVRIGMTRSDVQKVLGANPDIVERPPVSGLLYGGSGSLRLDLTQQYGGSWLIQNGLGGISFEHWPIRVWLDADNRVIRIERGDEVEGEPLPASVASVSPSAPLYPAQQHAQ